MKRDSSASEIDLAKYFGFLFVGANVLVGLYFLYFGHFEREKLQTAMHDITTITQGIDKSFGKDKYKNLNTNMVAMTALPYDMSTFKKEGSLHISNPFNGEFIIDEAVYNKKERTLYFALYDKQKHYHEVYSGVTAYLLVLTNLNRYECMQLAQVDWAAQYPNFMGIEPSFRSPKNPDNGTYNLANYVLADNQDEKDINTLTTIDEGKVFKTPLNGKEAFKQCKCFISDCTIALKFYNKPYVHNQDEKKIDKRFRLYQNQKKKK